MNREITIACTERRIHQSCSISMKYLDQELTPLYFYFCCKIYGGISRCRPSWDIRIRQSCKFYLLLYRKICLFLYFLFSGTPRPISRQCSLDRMTEASIRLYIWYPQYSLRHSFPPLFLLTYTLLNIYRLKNIPF